MTSVFVALVAGHLVADFVLQPAWLLRAKERGHGILLHGLVHAAAYAVLLVPLGAAVGVVAALAAVHALIDAGKTAMRLRGHDGVGLFLADQALHVATVAVAARWLAVRAPQITPRGIADAALIVGAAGFLVWGGILLVRAALSRIEAPDDTAPGAGAIVGVLERLLVYALVLVAAWDAIAFVMAAKGIARFEELKRRRFAEYYLVGTLASFLVAVLVGLFVRTALGR